jgi:hypothetical protein
MSNPNYTNTLYQFKGQDATLTITRIHSDSWLTSIDSEVVILDRDSLVKLREYIDLTLTLTTD